MEYNYLFDEPQFIGGGDNDAINITVYILLFLIIIIALYIIYGYYTNLSQQIQLVNMNTMKLQEQSPPSQVQQMSPNPQPNKLLIDVINNRDIKVPINPFREYDYRTLHDPLVAPRRRDDYNLPVLPLPTRGYPSAFKKMGLLIDKKARNDDKYKILLLMGRNTFPNSTSYDYYAVENIPYSALKFDIKNTRELQTGDEVKIHELNKNYSVTLDKMLGYEYDPYIY